MLRSTLSLLSVSGLLVSLVDPSQAGSGVTWLSPSDGDVYNSGDTIVGRWTSDDAVPSPSFRLCVKGVSRRSDDDNGDDSEDDGSDSDGDDDGRACGGDVWPTIEQSDSDSSYLIHMALPNATSTVLQCYLEMVDDNHNKSSSPIFTFQPSGAEDGTGDDSTSPADQASSADSSSAAPAASSDVPVASSTASPSPDASTPSSSPAQSPTASVSNANLQSTSSQTPASLSETRMPAPTAAYAVPLSLVLSVLLAAGGLSLHQRRKLRAERKLEQDALKTRATLSRASTLTFRGFMALGRGPSPLQHHPEGPSSRSTSVSMMRAWRRDVSQYDHDHGHHSTLADDDTYVAKTDDARSVFSACTLPKRAPRPQTREPFYTSSRGAPNHHPHHHHPHHQRPTVPAGLFRAGLSPRVPHSHPDDEDDWGKIRRVEKPLPSRGGRDCDEDDVNASANDEVMSRYFEFSPIPLSPPAPPRGTSPVSVPERLHVRRYAESAEYDKGLPPVPRVPEKDLYDVVARRLTRK